MHAAKFTRPMNCATRPSDDAELDEEIYKTTVEERKIGWLDERGPFTEEQLKKMLGPPFRSQPNVWDSPRKQDQGDR